MVYIYVGFTQKALGNTDVRKNDHEVCVSNEYLLSISNSNKSLQQPFPLTKGVRSVG